MNPLAHHRVQLLLKKLRRRAAHRLWRLGAAAPLRQRGLPVPWTFDEITAEWFGGTKLAWNTDDVELAFDTATKLRGVPWVLGPPLDMRAFPRIPGLGPRGGFGEFLRVFWFGQRMASIVDAPGSEELIRRVIADDPDAGEEAAAIHLLRSGTPTSDLEIEPSVRVGKRMRRPDFRIRSHGTPWVYAEVRRLHRSTASTQTLRLLERLAAELVNIDRAFHLEIILDRDLDGPDIIRVIDEARTLCTVGVADRAELPGIGLLIVGTGDARVVTPTPLPSDIRPRMAIARAVVGPDQLNRQILARVPFSDERAEDILSEKSKQLPKGECGLLLVNVNSQPSAFDSWSKRVPARFTPSQYTRVAGVILFMHSTLPTQRGLVWQPFVKLIANPNAAVPLPRWITDRIEELREETRRVSGRSD